MGDDSNKTLSAGDRWRPVASILNGYQEAADYVRNLHHGGGALPGLGTALQPPVVTIKNNSGRDCSRFDVLGIDSPIIAPADNTDVFLSRVGFSCVLPESPTHVGRFVVLLRPLRQGELGPAAIAGAVPVRVYVNSTDDEFCDVGDAKQVGGETCYLSSGGSGARILWKETGEPKTIVWATIQLDSVATDWMFELKCAHAPGETTVANPLEWNELEQKYLPNLDVEFNVTDPLKRYRGRGRGTFEWVEEQKTIPGSRGRARWNFKSGELEIIGLEPNALLIRGNSRGVTEHDQSFDIDGVVVLQPTGGLIVDQDSDHAFWNIVTGEVEFPIIEVRNIFQKQFPNGSLVIATWNEPDACWDVLPADGSEGPLHWGVAAAVEDPPTVDTFVRIAATTYVTGVDMLLGRSLELWWEGASDEERCAWARTIWHPTDMVQWFVDEQGRNVVLLPGPEGSCGPQGVQGYRNNILHEIDPAHIWNGVRKVIQACNCSRLRDPVQVVSASVSGDDFFPADKKGNPLANIISAYQTTGMEYEDYIIAKGGGEARIFERTGQPIRGNVYPLHRMLWIQEHQPKVYDRTWRFLGWEEYINYLLTGECVSDYSLVSRTLLFDINRRVWARAFIGKAGLDDEKLPTVVAPGKIIGKVKKKMAAELGLPSNCLVATGGFDQATASLGAGIVQPGDCSLSMGTVVASHWLTKERDSTKRDYSYCCSLAGNNYMGFFFSLNGCAVLNWFFKELGWKRGLSTHAEGQHDYCNRRISPDRPSPLFFLPHLAGATQPYNDPNSSGAIVGIRLNTTGVDVVKAIYEGIAFEARRNYDVLRKQNIAVGEIVAAGGGSRSNVWMQLMANVIGRTIRTLHNDEGSAMGAAMLGACASGNFNSVKEAAEAWIRPKREFTPDKASCRQIEAKYQEYLGLYQSIKSYNDFLRNSHA
jgi:xylulokinase